MAENESLDVGSYYATGWNLTLAAFQNSDSSEEIAPKVSKALYDGLRKALPQFRKKGVPLADWLNARDSRPRLLQLVRKIEGHQYAQLFESAAHASSPSKEDCLRGWVEAILDKVFDQILLQVAETDESRTFFDLQKLTDEVREIVAPDVDRIVANLARNPDWRPQREPGKAKASDAASPTAELLGMTLLGGKQP
jgi:hypothetical protein